MKPLEAFFLAHQTTIVVFIGWCFSVAMGTMPPLPENAGYFTRWAHDFLQLVAANLNRRTTSTTIVQTPTSTLEQTASSGPAVGTPPH